MRIKNIISAIMVGVMAIGFTACGKAEVEMDATSYIEQEESDGALFDVLDGGKAKEVSVGDFEALICQPRDAYPSVDYGQGVVTTQTENGLITMVNNERCEEEANWPDYLHQEESFPIVFKHFVSYCAVDSLDYVAYEEPEDNKYIAELTGTLRGEECVLLVAHSKEDPNVYYLYDKISGRSYLMLERAIIFYGEMDDTISYLDIFDENGVFIDQYGNF
jgi:hypothetical protein